MDIASWGEGQMRAWAEKDRMERVKDVEATYYEAKSIKPTLFDKKTWKNAAENFTRLCLLDAQARAVNASDAVERAISEGRVKGTRIKGLIEEEGSDFLPGAIFGMMYEGISEAFGARNWTGTGVDANDQSMRMAQCFEVVESTIVSYLEDPPPEWKNTKGGALDDGFLTFTNEVKERALSKAFSTPGGQDLSFG